MEFVLLCTSCVVGKQKGQDKSDYRSRVPGQNKSSLGGHLKWLRGMFWEPPCTLARRGFLLVGYFFKAREVGCAPAQVPPVKAESSLGSITRGCPLS